MMKYSVKALYFAGNYFAVFPMDVSLLEFNFAAFELLHC